MTTKPLWEERVRAWRESGKPLKEFAEEQSLAASKLRWWATHLNLDRQRHVHLARVVVRRTKVALVVEVEGARITLEHGFDRDLFLEVVRVLRNTREVA